MLQRNGKLVLHGHDCDDVAHSPFQHLIGVAVEQLRVHDAMSLTHMFLLGQRIGDDAGHGHCDTESAQLRSQHATCDDEQFALQLDPFVTHVPSEQRWLPRGHEQSVSEFTHLESQHWNWDDEHERHWS